MKNLLIATIFLLVNTIAFGQQVMPLYKDSIPNFIFTQDEETTTNNGVLIISKITRPMLTAYLPPKEKATGAAVVICPGGGYAVEAAGHEGADVAKELTKAGIAAFVLKYRLPNDAAMKNKEIGPLQDAQQAIKMVRDGAAKWNINPNRIGIMGFSAGGHLASTEGTHYAKSLIENGSNTSLRPDFMILVYPVISFQDSLGHIGSRDNLLGKNPAQEKKDYYSNEMQVTDSTPPAFLVHASDDDVVKVENSIAFYLALIHHHVPAEMHIYQNGGHGFGMHLPKNKDLWLDRCKNWMAANGWLKSSGVMKSITGM
ncbi:alpha/beta hydrolase [Ilyomonas limi]|uniref:Alpha/beta hydrolase n=1 Tax=Ilyomonas limi TaxID=2575867 RepID=A0A4U3KYH8_9BACT|nr:alpha/beta hydrolase [Ilyomonas limi]TKK67715.1 alpha/beta hydrolase [Ilyomonas limi]